MTSRVRPRKARGRRKASPTLQQLLERYAAERPNVGYRAIQQYEVSIRHLERYAGHAVTLDDLADSPLLSNWLRWIVDSGRTRRTANGKRQAVLTVWRWAYRARLTPHPVPDVPKFRDPTRTPTAWTMDQVGKLLEACERADTVRNQWTGREWTGQHWRGLVLTVYDTSLRLGCLLSARREYLNSEGWLHIPAELQKHGADTRHKLHETTLDVLQSLPDAELLFPWPLSRRAIWIEFRKVLQSAGLASTRRDLFHKLRRTSYTHVYDTLGARAATEHAGHRTDLSRAYYDPTLHEPVAAADAIPRPSIPNHQ